MLSYFYPEKGGKVVTQLLRRSSPKLELWKTLRVESAEINAGRGEVPGDIGEEDRGRRGQTGFIGSGVLMSVIDAMAKRPG